MKFAVGYQLAEVDEEAFSEIVRDFSEHIEEVYFPWLDMPSGRSPMTSRDGFVDWGGQRKLERDLRLIKEMGIKLDLLLNANCYGRLSLSHSLVTLVCSVVAHLREYVGLDAVTTTSPMIAKSIKENFAEIDVRASVNMRIGTVKGMQYLADLFDSFYIRREYNRDFGRIAELKEWADERGRRLYILVNSGCLNYCSGQTFHDNLVAHEAEISETKNITDWNPSVCWRYYRRQENWVAFLQNSWIRPEDLHSYDTYFAVAKLATRMHANPKRVIRAYVGSSFRGNLMDLLEPGYGPAFFGYIIHNSRFPEDWFERTTNCDKRCGTCGYCACVLRRVLVRVDKEDISADIRNS